MRRNGLGQLGFHVHYQGVVVEVDPYGFAWQAGLRKGSRLVEVSEIQGEFLHTNNVYRVTYCIGSLPNAEPNPSIHEFKLNHLNIGLEE